MGVVPTAAVSLASSGDASTFVPLPTAPVAVLLIAGMACVNFWGRELSTRVNVVFTGIEVAGLLIIRLNAPIR